MAAITVRRELTANDGRYVGEAHGVEGEAVLEISRRGPALIAAVHTFAPPTMRGTGAAKALVERLVGDARAEGFKIVPVCPYVRSQLGRHPQWADVAQF